MGRSQSQLVIKFVVARVIDLGLGVWIWKGKAIEGESGGIGGVARLETRRWGLDIYGDGCAGDSGVRQFGYKAWRRQRGLLAFIGEIRNGGGEERR